MQRSVFQLGVLVAVVLATGCSHVIRIERTRPARLNLSTERKIGVHVEPLKKAEGVQTAEAVGALMNLAGGQLIQTEMAVEPVRNEFHKQLHASRFQLVDRSGADTVVKVTPTKWQYRGPPPLSGGTGKGTLHIRLDVYDGQGEGAQVLFSETYWASANASNEAEAILRASNRLASAFVDELQPYRVWAKVELDDSDPATRPGIELCDRGMFDAAHQAFTDILARTPNSAPVMYNLAVLDEARGDYGKAEQLLTSATRIQSKPMYYAALERVRQSAAELAELRNPR